MALSRAISRMHLGEGSAYLKKQKATGSGSSGGSSSWANQLSDLYSQIAGRKFDYDQSQDPFFDQYRQMYEHNAKLAMQDTVGQVSALTGGYANSYAETAGQAVYNQNMAQLNEKALELRQQAMEIYQMEGSDLMNAFNVASTMYGNEYQKERDAVADQQWAQQFAESQRQFNAQQAYNYSRAAASDSQWAQQFAYQKSRDAAADDQWAQQFAYQKERDAVSDDQYAQDLAYRYAALNKSASTSSGSGKSSGAKKSSSGVTVKNNVGSKKTGDDDGRKKKINESTGTRTKNLEEAEAAIMTEQEFRRRKTLNGGTVTQSYGKFNTYEDYVTETALYYSQNGRLTDAEAKQMVADYYKAYGGAR